MTRHPFPRQVRAHGFSVSSQMPGNSPHRPTPLPQRVYSPRIPPVPTSAVGLPLLAAGSDTQQLGEDPTQRLVFVVTGWGFSLIESGEFQRSSTPARQVRFAENTSNSIEKLVTAGGTCASRRTRSTASPTIRPSASASASVTGTYPASGSGSPRPGMAPTPPTPPSWSPSDGDHPKTP